MPNRRPTGNEPEEDRVAQWLMEVVEIVKEKRQIFLGGLVGIVALVMVANLVTTSREQERTEATTLLGDVLVAEGSARPEEAIRLCEKLIDEYPGTPAADQGLLLLANRYYSQARHDDALRLYERFLADSGENEILVFAAWSGMAACYEAQGRLLEAARKYEDYAAKHPESFQSSLALMEAARCFSIAGDESAQLRTLKRVTTEFADSPVAARAQLEINML
jgi:tetratricopeptide (TPR) repeat protein